MTLYHSNQINSVALCVDPIFSPQPDFSIIRGQDKIDFDTKLTLSIRLQKERQFINLSIRYSLFLHCSHFIAVDPYKEISKDKSLHL
jgi:hypothetical protein